MATAHRLAANRFDLIRLALASAVFAYHAIVLSALAPMSGLERVWGQIAEIAIQGFFIVSGALVAGSLMRSQNLADYAGKRVRRLYPAYAVVILIPALISLLMGVVDVEDRGSVLSRPADHRRIAADDAPRAVERPGGPVCVGGGVA